MALSFKGGDFSVHSLRCQPSVFQYTFPQANGKDNLDK